MVFIKNVELSKSKNQASSLSVIKMFNLGITVFKRVSQKYKIYLILNLEFIKLAPFLQKYKYINISYIHFKTP